MLMEEGHSRSIRMIPLKTLHCAEANLARRTPMEPPHRLSKTICMPFESETHYATCLRDTETFRRYIDHVLADAPELFPPEMGEGFCFYGVYRSRKQRIALGRIRLAATGDVFQIRPAFLM